jgi:hypothetical protein
MRDRTCLFVIPLLLAIFPIVSQSQTQTSLIRPAALQDAQAVTILNQSLTAAGGLQAIKAVADYSASGDITFHRSPTVQGTATIKGLGSIDFRLDANLPTGVRSFAVHDGQTAVKHENGQLAQLAPASPRVPSSDAHPYQTALFPSSIAFPDRQLTNVLANPSFRISYKGTTQVDSHSVHDIEVQWISLASTSDPMSRYHSREFFIDTSTFQIVMTQDYLPKNAAHQIHYSNYSQVSGILVPFTFTEYLGGDPTWTIQLHQMTFNSGLQNSDFVLQ